MSTPVPDADAAEQRTAATGEPTADLPREVPDEAAEGDALEQAAPVAPDGGEPAGERPLEADDADAAEQARAVPLDEDEGRE